MAGTKVRGGTARSASKRVGRQAKRAGRRWSDAVERHLPPPIRGVVERARRDDVMLFSAGLGFYALVSVVPLVIVSIWITSLVIGAARVHELAQAIGRVAPKNLGADAAVRRVADQGTRLGLWAVLTGLWPATAYGSGLKRSFDRLAGEREGARGLRGRGLTLVVILPLFVVGSLAGSFAGSTALGSTSIGRVVGAVVALVIGFVVAAAALAVVYWAFPAEHLPVRSILRGTAVAAAGISVLSLGFVLFLAAGTNFQQHYASSGLAIVVLLAVWLFLSNALLLVGFKYALESAGRG